MRHTVAVLGLIATAAAGCGPEPALDERHRSWTSSVPDDTGMLLPGDTINAAAGGSQPVSLTPGQKIVQVAMAELNKTASQIGKGITAYPYDLGRYLYSGEAYCSEFVSWVYKVAGYPLTGGSEQGGWMHKSTGPLVSWHKQHATFVARGSSAWSSYTPQPGDYIYYVWSSGSTHSGIVDHVSGQDLKTVEGNVNKLVLALTRKNWRQYTSIKGFGVRNLGPAPKQDAGTPPPKQDAGTPPPPPPKQDTGAPPPKQDTGPPPPHKDTGRGPGLDTGGFPPSDAGVLDMPSISRSEAGAGPQHGGGEILIGGCTLAPRAPAPWALLLPTILVVLRRRRDGSPPPVESDRRC